MSDPANGDARRAPEEWADVFDDVRSTYFEFGQRLENLVHHLLDDAGVEYEYTNHLVLRTGFLLDRMYVRLRSGTAIDDPRRNETDLVTVLVVVRTIDEIASVCEVVERELVVDWDASQVAAGHVLNDDLVGEGRVDYTGPKLVVTLPDIRQTLPEWAEYHGFRAEVEVRTVVQQAWQTLYDAREFTVDDPQPDAYRRALAQAASAFAVADEHAAQVQQALDDAHEQATAAVGRGELDLPIDAASLAAYVLGSETMADVVRTAQHAGMREDMQPDAVGNLEDQLWVVRWAGFETIRDLDDLLRKEEGRIPALLNSFTEVATAEGFVPAAVAEDLVSFVTLMLNRADRDAVAMSRWSDTLQAALNTVIGNPRTDMDT